MTTPVGSLQYQRRFSCVATGTGGTLEFSPLKCVFNVSRGDIQTPNSCNVRIYNLAIALAGKLNPKEFSTLTVRAGYDGNFAQIFKGSVKQVRTGRLDAKDSYVDITAADGDHAYNYAYISEPLANASPNTVMGQINAAMARFGINKGPQALLDTNKLPRGKVLYGPTKEVLREVSQQNDCNWSLQDGALTLIPKAAILAGQPLEISANTGLIGVPEQTANGIEVRVLLNPAVKIGTRIQLLGDVNKLQYGLSNTQRAQNYLLQRQVGLNKDGLYYVMYAEHSGDSRGQNWYTDMVCLSITAGLPPDIDLSNKLFVPDDTLPPVL